MAEQNSIRGQIRARVGTGSARSLRRDGQIPAIVYGAKQDSLAISLDPREISKGLQSGRFYSTVFDIDVDNGKAERVLPREVQFHPVTDRPLHVDFLRVTGETRINVEVPVVFLNEDESPGLRRGGVLNVVRHTIEVICAVSIIPDRFEFDLKDMDIGDSVHFGVITLPEGVDPAITDRDFTVATISAPTIMEEAEEEEIDGEEGEEGEEGQEGEGETPEEEASEDSESN